MGLLLGWCAAEAADDRHLDDSWTRTLADRATADSLAYSSVDLDTQGRNRPKAAQTLTLLCNVRFITKSHAEYAF